MEEEEEDMYAPDEDVDGYSPVSVPVKDEKMDDAQGTGNEEEESEEDSDSVSYAFKGYMVNRF